LVEKLVMITESCFDHEDLEGLAKQVLSEGQRDFFVSAHSFDRRLKKVQSDFCEILKDMVCMGYKLPT
jgi:hypothetical protein